MKSELVKKTIRLHRVWDDLVREYARRSGLKQIQVIEKLLSYGNERFREEYGLGEESEQGTANEKKNAIDMAKKQHILHLREQREKDWQIIRENHWRQVIFAPLKELDEHGTRESDFSRLYPRDIWDRLLGRRKEDEWQPVE